MNAVEIVFSPTGGTEKVADIIGKHWDENPAKIDLSDAAADFSKCEITRQDMAVIAMPSFGGRAPAVAIDRLKKSTGTGQDVSSSASMETGHTRIRSLRWRTPRRNAVSK